MPAMSAIFNLCEEIASDGETLKILRECGTLDLFTPGSSADFDMKLSLTDDGRIEVKVEILGMYCDGFEMRFCFNPHVVEAEKRLRPIDGKPEDDPSKLQITPRVAKAMRSVLDTIEKAGTNGVTEREINRNHRHVFGSFSNVERRQILKMILRDHLIEKTFVRRVSGRTAEVFRLSPRKRRRKQKRKIEIDDLI